MVRTLADGYCSRLWVSSKAGVMGMKHAGQIKIELHIWSKATVACQLEGLGRRGDLVVTPLFLAWLRVSSNVIPCEGSKNLSSLGTLWWHHGEILVLIRIHG